MIESGREDRLPDGRGTLDLDLVEVLAPHRRGLRAPAVEGRGSRSASHMEVAHRLLETAEVPNPKPKGSVTPLGPAPRRENQTPAPPPRPPWAGPRHIKPKGRNV